MAVEIIGKGKDVKRYREYLHRQGILTKRYCQTMEKQGHVIAPKPEGFRTFNTPIKSVYSLKKVNGVEKAIKKLDPDQRLFIQGIANANIVDRMDERLEPAGVDLENFMLNPVLLLDHLYTSRSTVGKVLRLDSQSDGVHFDAFIGDPSKAPLTLAQEETRSLVAQALLQTVSVGFIPHKIKAPEFGDEGELINPAIILIWELLELSIVAVPANPGSVFDVGVLSNSESETKILSLPSSSLKASDGDVNENKQDSDESTAIERIIFRKEDYTVEEAKEYAKASQYKSDDVEENEQEFAFIQRPKTQFVEGSLKPIELNDGVKGLVGKLKTEIVEEERAVDKADQILDELKKMATIANSNGETLRKIVEQNEKIIATSMPKEDEKKVEEDDDENPKPLTDEEKEEMSGKEDDEKSSEKEDDEMEDKKVMSEVKRLAESESSSKKELGELKEVVKSVQMEIDKLSSIMLHFAKKSGLVSVDADE